MRIPATRVPGWLACLVLGTGFFGTAPAAAPAPFKESARAPEPSARPADPLCLADLEQVLNTEIVQELRSPQRTVA